MSQSRQTYERSTRAEYKKIEMRQLYKSKIKTRNMDVKILKDEKDELQIEFSETDEGFLNLVKNSVWQQSGVEFAGFRIEHPETSMPIFVIKSKGKKAKDIWNSAVEAISEELEKFGKELKKLK